jgi:hypothetical protein
MANGGAFGNPLTTGIALNFEVDMTPYRQMMQDNLQFAQTQAAEKKKKEKEFQDILKNIAYDDSKIHTRMRDDARVEYAATIEDVMELKKKNDFGGIMNRIAKFDSKLNNYVDTTTNFRAYEKAAEDGKSWVDMDYINAYNNPDKFDDRYLIDKFSDVATYDKEAGVFSAQAIPKQDEVAFVNNYMQGMKDQFVRDDQGKIKTSGVLSETGDYAYLKAKSADPESFYQELGIAWLGGGGNNIEHMRRKLGLKPEDLEGSIDTPSGPVAKSLYYATEFMKGVSEPKMYSEELRRPQEKESKGYNDGYGKTDEYSYEFVDDPKPIYGNLPASQTGGKGGQELLVDVDNSMVFQNLGKTAKKFAINIPAGSFEIGSEGTEYTPISSTQKGLNDAIALQSYSDKNGKLWYKVASKAEIEQLDVFEAAYRRSQGVDDIDYTSLSKYAKTYLIPSSSEVDSQFWQGVGVNRKEREVIIKDLKGGTSTTGTQPSASNGANTPSFR